MGARFNDAGPGELISCKESQFLCELDHEIPEKPWL